MLRGKEDFATTWNNLPDTEYHLMLLYLMFMVLQVTLHEIPYSDEFKASWVYFSAPLEKPGEILSGTIKAMFVRLFVPGYVIISVFVLIVWGPKALDDILFGLIQQFSHADHSGNDQQTLPARFRWHRMCAVKRAI